MASLVQDLWSGYTVEAEAMQHRINPRSVHVQPIWACRWATLACFRTW